MDYYLDESGNTGDLINRQNDIGFANQPIFSYSCIGIADTKMKELELFINELKKEHGLDEKHELKSKDQYIKNPELIHEIVKYIIRSELPIICEVVDKKYNVAVFIVSNLIIPPMEDESDGRAQYIRDVLLDFITSTAPDSFYSFFFDLCKNPNEENLFKALNSLKEFFESERESINDGGNTIKMIDATLADYYTLRELSDNEEIIEMFLPVSDSGSKGKKFKILPNIYSFYNQIARLNKIHSKKLNEVNLYHDTTNEFADTLRFCINNIKTIDADHISLIPTCDYNVTENVNLSFVDSKDSIGVQVADIVAGFLNRYVYGLLYKEIDMKNIYHIIFDKLMEYNRTNNSLGTNFVLPVSKRQAIFKKFYL